MDTMPTSSALLFPGQGSQKPGMAKDVAAGGAIGTQALDVIRANPNRFEVVGLAVGSNRALLEELMALADQRVSADRACGGSRPLRPQRQRVRLWLRLRLQGVRRILLLST